MANTYILDILTRYKDGASAGLAKTDSAVGKFAKTAGTVMVAGLAAGAVALGAFSVKAIMAGSDAEETRSKFKAVFKDMSGSVQEWSDSVATGMGLTKSESLGMLASIQDLLVPMGMARDEAAGLSQKTLALAADLGSFNNVNTADVVRDINSALVGESEPMKKYGVLVTAAAVKTKALEMGLIAEGEELDNTSRAMATMQIIMESTTDAQGDLERTSGSFANQMRQTKAILGDTVATIGEGMLPLITPLIVKFNQFAKETLPPMVEYITGKLLPGLQGMMDKASGVTVQFGYVSDWFAENLPLIQSLWDEHGAGIVRIVTNTFDTIKVTIDTVLKTVLGLVKTVLQLLDGDWSGALDTLSETAGTVWAGIQTIFGNQLDSLLTLVSEFAPRMYDKGKEWIGGLLDGLKSAWTGVANWFGGLSIPGFGGNNAPGYASGTPYAPGGLAYVHAGEMVALPRGSQVYTANQTANMGGGLGGAMSVAINIYTNDAREAGRRVREELSVLELRRRRGG